MRKAGRKISNINVVPYLDVMLVLLVIFMITAPLFNLGEIRLPESGGTTTQSAGFRIVYGIGEGRPFKLHDPETGGAPSEPMDRRALTDALRLICWSDAGRTRGVIIAADEKRFYGEVVGALMDDVRAAGCEGDFSLTVIPKNESG